MIDLRANLTSCDQAGLGIARMNRRTFRELITPGALVRAGSALDWWWVRVEVVSGDEVLFSKVMPRAPHCEI